MSKISLGNCPLCRNDIHVFAPPGSELHDITEARRLGSPTAIPVREDKLYDQLKIDDCVIELEHTLHNLEQRYDQTTQFPLLKSILAARIPRLSRTHPGVAAINRNFEMRLFNQKQDHTAVDVNSGEAVSTVQYRGRRGNATLSSGPTSYFHTHALPAIEIKGMEIDITETHIVLFPCGQAVHRNCLYRCTPRYNTKNCRPVATIEDRYDFPGTGTTIERGISRSIMFNDAKPFGTSLPARIFSCSCNTCAKICRQQQARDLGMAIAQPLAFLLIPPSLPNPATDADVHDVLELYPEAHIRTTTPADDAAFETYGAMVHQHGDGGAPAPEPRPEVVPITAAADTLYGSVSDGNLDDGTYGTAEPEMQLQAIIKSAITNKWRRNLQDGPPRFSYHAQTLPIIGNVNNLPQLCTNDIELNKEAFLTRIATPKPELFRRNDRGSRANFAHLAVLSYVDFITIVDNCFAQRIFNKAIVLHHCGCTTGLHEYINPRYFKYRLISLSNHEELIFPYVSFCCPHHTAGTEQTQRAPDSVVIFHKHLLGIQHVKSAGADLLQLPKPNTDPRLIAHLKMPQIISQHQHIITAYNLLDAAPMLDLEQQQTARPRDAAQGLWNNPVYQGHQHLSIYASTAATAAEPAYAAFDVSQFAGLDDPTYPAPAVIAGTAAQGGESQYLMVIPAEPTATETSRFTADEFPSLHNLAATTGSGYLDVMPNPRPFGAAYKDIAPTPDGGAARRSSQDNLLAPTTATAHSVASRSPHPILPTGRHMQFSFHKAIISFDGRNQERWYLGAYVPGKAKGCMDHLKKHKRKYGLLALAVFGVIAALSATRNGGGGGSGNNRVGCVGGLCPDPSSGNSNAPTGAPTGVPSGVPTLNPFTGAPTSQPTGVPTGAGLGTFSPTAVPSFAPTTSSPSGVPTFNPSTGAPTGVPTFSPFTEAPTDTPTVNPTTGAPTGAPSTAAVVTNTTRTTLLTSTTTTTHTTVRTRPG